MGNLKRTGASPGSTVAVATTPRWRSRPTQRPTGNPMRSQRPGAATTATSRLVSNDAGDVDAGAVCAPGATQCSGNGVQTCRPPGRGVQPGPRELGLRRGGLHRRVQPGGDAVLGQRRADLRRHRHLGHATPCTARRACWGVHRRRAPRAHAVFGRRRADLRPRQLGRAQRVRERVRPRRVHRACAPGPTQCSGNAVQTCDTGVGTPVPCNQACVPAGAPACARRRHAVLGQRRSDVRRDRDLGRASACPRVRVGLVHGRLHAGLDAVLGQRRADVRRHRQLGQRAGLQHEACVTAPARASARRARRSARATACRRAATSGTWSQPRLPVRVRGGRVHRRVRAGRDAVLGQRRADVRRGRHLGHAVAVQPGVRVGRVHGLVHAGRDAVLGQRRADVRRDGHLGRAGRCTNQACVSGRVHGRVRAGGDAVLGQRRPDLRRERHAGERPPRARTRPAHRVLHRASARPARRSARATACRPAARPARGAAAASCGTRRASTGRARACARPERRSARATASRPAAPTALGAAPRRARTRRASTARARARAHPVHPVLGQRRADLQCSGHLGGPGGVHQLGVRRAAPARASCAPGATQCSGNGVQTCDSSGQWGSAAPAPTRRASGGACTGVCAPGATQCSGNGVQTCSASGQWGTASACTDRRASSGACTGVCAPGAMQCSGNGVQTCARPGRGAREPRARTPRASAGRAPASCAPGAAQCSGNGVQTCSASGHVGHRDRVREPGVRERGVHRRVHAGHRRSARATACRPATPRATGAGPWRAPTRVRQTGVRRRVLAGVDAVLGQRGADVHSDGDLGQPDVLDPACVSGACTGRARRATQCSGTPSDLQRDGPWGAPASCTSRPAWAARARGRARRGHAVLGQRRPDVQFERTPGARRSRAQLGLRGRRVHRLVCAGEPAVQRPAAADVQHGHLARGGLGLPTRRA